MLPFLSCSPLDFEFSSILGLSKSLSLALTDNKFDCSIGAIGSYRCVSLLKDSFLFSLCIINAFDFDLPSSRLMKGSKIGSLLLDSSRILDISPPNDCSRPISD